MAGASALSILTDEKFFGGKNADLTEARKCNLCPILRKEFIIDEYQVTEAKSIGADAILLIAAVLEKDKIKSLAEHAFSLGMEVLLELHDEEEINKVPESIEIIGINNRDLKTFKVDIEQSKRMSKLLGNNVVKVAESGIDSVEVIVDLKKHGFNGFLMGEYFMKTSHPGKTCEAFIRKLKEMGQH
jgi:indole-3-glycerol phosphate synthase